MLTQTVHLIEPTPSLLFRETPYRYLTPKRFGWAARMLWRLLGKLDALEPFHEKVTTWSYRRIAARPINEALMDSLDVLLRQGRDLEDFAFVIGGKDFQDLAMSPTFTREITFETGPFRYYWSNFHVPIHVVPHMEGIAVIPKVIIVKTEEE